MSEGGKGEREQAGESKMDTVGRVCGAAFKISLQSWGDESE